MNTDEHDLTPAGATGNLPHYRITYSREEDDEQGYTTLVTVYSEVVASTHIPSHRFIILLSRAREIPPWDFYEMESLGVLSPVFIQQSGPNGGA